MYNIHNMYKHTHTHTYTHTHTHTHTHIHTHLHMYTMINNKSRVQHHLSFGTNRHSFRKKT